MFKNLFALTLSLALSACSTMQAEEAFTALPVDQRSIASPHIDWVATPDAIQLCEALGKHGPKGTVIKTDQGCSLWSKSVGQCTILTLRDTHHSVLGHEFRHCVEGHFHAPPPVEPTSCK